MTEQVFIVKADGTREPFDVSKLEQSLMHAGTSQALADQVIEHVKSELSDGMTTHEIYRHAFEILHKQEKPIALTYSLKRAVMELGPSGFPFEKYVAEIFKAQGYEVMVDQEVRGHCVTHEIDVVAWTPVAEHSSLQGGPPSKLIMVEAKFHNDPVMKSDLKVILYVKARYDDLHDMNFNFGGRERKLDQGWLVTNTKFSSAAIEYGSCQGGIVMVGWDYPPSVRHGSGEGDHSAFGNLHDMLIENKLHPVTCLTTLNGHHKKALLEKGIVLCKNLVNNPAALILAGVDEQQIKKVEEEIGML